jgi:hypothetical protein
VSIVAQGGELPHGLRYRRRIRDEMDARRRLLAGSEYTENIVGFLSDYDKRRIGGRVNDNPVDAALKSRG